MGGHRASQRRHTQPLFPEAARGETGGEGRRGEARRTDGRTDDRQQWNSNGEETKRASEERGADSFRLGWEASRDRHHYPE